MPTDTPSHEALRAANRLASGQWTRASDTTVARHIDAGLCLPELLALEKAVRACLLEPTDGYSYLRREERDEIVAALRALDAAREKRDG